MLLQHKQNDLQEELYIQSFMRKKLITEELA
jgi:hypothetical protein